MLRIRKLVLAVAAASALSSGMANALGLGELTLKSAQNQPQDAELHLVSRQEGASNYQALLDDLVREGRVEDACWMLDQFGPTTDAPFFWEQEMTPEMMAANSPHRSVGAITTPMLVIHGDRDYRVPIGEGLRLWWELLSASGLPAGEDGTSPHRFLYFPNENHWVLSPQHAKVWYEVVLGFLDEHVRGIPATPPETLG